MSNIIIGLVGPIASGKSVVSDYLDKKGFLVEKLSNRLREEAKMRGLECTRELLQDLGNELRAAWGPGYLAEWTIKKFENHDRPICLDGVRNPGEVEVIKRMGGMILGIDASSDKRLEWYMGRSMSREEDQATREEFLKADSRDSGVGESGLGQQVSECLRLADRVIDNNKTVVELLNQVETIVDDWLK